MRKFALILLEIFATLGVGAFIKMFFVENLNLFSWLIGGVITIVLLEITIFRNR